MKIVVGLCNWGMNFDGTRHNVGYDVISALVNRHNCQSRLMGPNGSSSATSAIYDLERMGAVLLLPTTGMNDGGPAVKQILDLTGLTDKDVIVIHDYMDFEPGEVKIKQGGGDGRHNGLKSIIKHIGSNFTRVRVGIGKPKSKEQGIDFVLGKFSKAERKVMDDAIITAMGAVEHILEHGVNDAMNLYNRRKTNV